MNIDDAIIFASHRMRLARGTRFAAYASMSASALFALYVLFVSLWPIVPFELWYAMLPLAVGLCAFPFGYLQQMPGRTAVAAAIDRELLLDERTSTATYAVSEPAISEARPDLLEALLGQAQESLRGVDRSRLRRAFRLPRLHTPAWVFGGMLLTFVLAPMLSPIVAALPSQSQVDAARQQRESKAVREAARKLVKDAKELERIAALKKLDAARQAARKLAQQAERMVTRPPGRREGLAKLSKMSEELRRAVLGDSAASKGLAGTRQGSPFGPEPIDEEFMELAKLLDELGAQELMVDLAAFRDKLTAEARRAREEGREPKVDIAELEDLIKRIREARGLLERMDEMAASNSPLADLFKKMSERQRELLEKLQAELEKFAGL